MPLNTAVRPVLYLGNKAYSSWSLRPWLALKHAGAEFDEVVIPLDQPETQARLRAVSPSGRVPVLVDGELVIWESLAICEYAAERRPTARLWPEDPAARATARSVASEMHAGFAALRQAMPMKLNRAPAPLPQEQRTDAVRADVARIVTLWTETRARHGAGGDFLFGHYTIADAMFAPVVTRFRTYAVPLPDEAAAYAEAVWRDPPMQAWVEAAAGEAFRMARYGD